MYELILQKLFYIFFPACLAAHMLGAYQMDVFNDAQL